MRTRVRQVSIGDHAPVVTLFGEYLHWHCTGLDGEAARHYLEARLRRENSVVYCAQRGRRTVGFAQVYRSNSRWVLHDLFVTPRSRRGGAGRALLDRVLADAVEQGADAVTLETAAANHRARGLYESAGFQHSVIDNAFVEYTLRVAS